MTRRIAYIEYSPDGSLRASHEEERHDLNYDAAGDAAVNEAITLVKNAAAVNGNRILLLAETSYRPEALFALRVDDAGRLVERDEHAALRIADPTIPDPLAGVGVVEG